jgi:fido (protein-threonine AMPylation protein)
MTPTDCGGWEYKEHATYHLLPKRCDKVFANAKADSSYLNNLLANTSGVHSFLFEGMTPDNQPYLAGNYRGSDFPCLFEREISIGTTVNGKPLILHDGSPPDKVAAEMEEFHADLLVAIGEMEAAKALLPKPLTDRVYLTTVSEIAANFLQLIFTIHPYVNGNGHIGRILVSFILLKLGIKPRRWTLDIRPQYDTAVQMHRMGYPHDLTNLILKAIAG